MTSCRSSSIRQSPTSASWRADSTCTVFTSGARFLFGTPPEKEVGGPVVVLGGKPNREALEGINATSKVVVIVMDYSKGPAAGGMNQLLGAVFELHPVGVVILSNRESAGWANRMKPAYRPGVRLAGAEGRPPIVEVNDAALASVLAAGGVDVAKIRADTSTVILTDPALKVMEKVFLTHDIHYTVS